MDSIPGSGISPGGGHGNPLRYSCLENTMDRGAWWTTVHRVAKSQDLATKQPQVYVLKKILEDIQKLLMVIFLRCGTQDSFYFCFCIFLYFLFPITNHLCRKKIITILTRLMVERSSGAIQKIVKSSHQKISPPQKKFKKSKYLSSLRNLIVEPKLARAVPPKIIKMQSFAYQDFNNYYKALITLRQCGTGTIQVYEPVMKYSTCIHIQKLDS